MMISAGRLCETFLNTQRYLGQKEKALLASNAPRVHRILRPSDPFDPGWTEHQQCISEAFALAATHAGYLLTPSDIVLFGFGATEHPAIRGETSSPDIGKAEVVITNLPLVKSALDQAIAAEFGHAVDFLWRNRRGQLNSLQQAAVAVDQNAGARFAAQNYSLRHLPASYTAFCVGEAVDHMMQGLAQPLESSLQWELGGLLLSFSALARGGFQTNALVGFALLEKSPFFGIVPQVIHHDLFAYIEGLKREILGQMGHSALLDLVFLAESSSLGLPSPHVGASYFEAMTEIKLLEWWLNGYLRGNQEKAACQALQMFLQLSLLADIFYRQISINSEEYHQAKKVGTLVDAAIGLEALFRAEEQIKEFRKIKQTCDLNVQFRPTLLGGSTVVEAHFDHQLMAHCREAAAHGLDSKDSMTAELQQIARNGTLADIESWNGELIRGQERFMVLESPVLAITRSVSNASSPADLEELIRQQVAVAIGDIPGGWPGKEEESRRLKGLVARTERTWAGRRSSEGQERINLRPGTTAYRVALEEWLEAARSEMISEGSFPKSPQDTAAVITPNWNALLEEIATLS